MNRRNPCHHQPQLLLSHKLTNHKLTNRLTPRVLLQTVNPMSHPQTSMTTAADKYIRNWNKVRFGFMLMFLYRWLVESYTIEIHRLKRLDQSGLRGKAESALQTTALDEPCEYPAGRVTKEKVERRVRSVATEATTSEWFAARLAIKILI